MAINKTSAQETANHFGISNSTLVSTWKLKFLNGGIDALCKVKGRPPMKKSTGTKKTKLTREQELERENELLRAEIAYLKKLKASGLNILKRLQDNTKQK